MPNPQLTIFAVVALMIFSACQREHILGGDPDHVLEDSEIDLRCCPHLTDEILESRNYQDIWDNFHVGLIEPTLNLFEAMDTAYLYGAIRTFEQCVLSGRAPEFCAEDLLDALSVKAFLETINGDAIDSLRHEFADIPDDQFYSSLDEAFAASLADLADDHRLDCFFEYRANLRSASESLSKILLASGQFGQAIATAVAVVKIINARLTFCECLYANYGSGC